MTLYSINPYTMENNATYEEHSDEEISEIIEKVQASFQQWKRRSFNDRAEYLRKAAEILEQEAASWGNLMTREMGKIQSGGEAEARKCSLVCNFYADKSAEFLKQEEIPTDADRSYITYNPLGVILAVMPWNFPFWQVFRFAAPALMAGNTVLLKHASNVPGCALALEEIFRRAGFPADVFRTLLISSNRVEQVIRHPLVQAVTLTGSTAAGKAVAAAAGAELKKTVLELGGSDPYIILDDADLEEAARICYNSKMINSGQSCIAAKRFILTPRNEAEFIQRFTTLMEATVMGDPAHPGTQLGPLARSELRDVLHKQVTSSIRAGANCLLGGFIPDRTGAFYPPTILTNVKPGTPAYEEELFGPVAVFITARDEADAIRIANDTSFGLGAAIFSRNLHQAEFLAATELEAGCCFVNSFVKSDPRLPFGGIRQSGYGRELSACGIREFVNIKTVYVK
ncbi:MAG: NAD-dependent succinate-semialdehyde dehydrogenase [Candidatus Cloacimonetes bacterium]|nr:NAD-dependent succinate-semialdehyde dehydrogenase [Candidatus Cloacimonadota bacterium]